MRNVFFLILLSIGLLACNQEQKKPASAETPASAPAQPPQAMLPSIPIEILQNLWENCDGVDYLFHNLPISMSLPNKASIQNALTHIASQAAPQLAQCKPIGRIFYMIKGENVVIADLYFTSGCTYFVFLENEKPVYANYMTSQGIQYLNNIITQAGANPVN